MRVVSTRSIVYMSNKKCMHSHLTKYVLCYIVRTLIFIKVYNIYIYIYSFTDFPINSPYTKLILFAFLH